MIKIWKYQYQCEFINTITLTTSLNVHTQILFTAIRMYFETISWYDCNYTFSLILIFLNLYNILVSYRTFAFYILDDGHMAGRNMQQFILRIKLTLACMCTLIGAITVYTGWHTKYHTTVCTHNTFLLLQKQLTSGTELNLIGWKIVPNESL